MFYKQHILENVRNRGTETKKIVKISAIFLFLSQKQSYFLHGEKDTDDGWVCNSVDLDRSTESTDYLTP